MKKSAILQSSTTVRGSRVSNPQTAARSNFYRTIIHELVHIQQETNGNKIAKNYFGYNLSLSAIILKEGIPDFIAKLVYPFGNNGNNYNYGIQTEEWLKTKLRNEIYGTDLTYWIYNANTVSDQPKDLGYFMGSRISESYFKLMSTIPINVTELIEIKSAKKFIKKSNYFD